MKIAVVHSSYRSDVPSGENSVVAEQCKALSAAGHQVLLVVRDSDYLMRSAVQKIRAAITVATGFGPSPIEQLTKFKPDVIHVHNLFPNFGEHWIKSAPAPIVLTLHNFRSVCANGLLFRDGQKCTECPDGDKRAALRHSCYRESKLATLPLFLANNSSLSKRRLFTDSAATVVLSDLAREMFLKFGFPDSRKLHVIPNSTSTTHAFDAELVRSHWIAAGRFSPEKGMKTLISSWPENQNLLAVGDGPELASCRELRHPNVKYLGQVDHPTLLMLIAACQGVVIPSECFEMQPTVAIEALAAGVPVLAKKGNAAADLVRRFACGKVYANADELADGIRQIHTDRENFSVAAKVAYDEFYSTSAWVQGMTALYESLVEERSRGSEL